MSGNTLLRDNLTLAVESFYTAKDSEGCSPKTLDAYQRAINRFIPYIRSNGISDPKQITPAHVRSYFAELNKQGYTAHTVHDYARPVKTLLRFWHADDLMPTDVMKRVTMPRLTKPVLPAFTRVEVNTLLRATEADRDKTLILFLLDTGVRASELCALKVADFDVTTGAVMVRMGKGGKGRTVFCGAKSRRAVLRYLLSRDNPATDAPLFPSVNDGQHLKPNGLLQLLRRLERKSGVANVHPHTFRRTFALWSLRAGMDIVRLAALLGHSDLTVVRQYLAIVEDDLQDAHEQHNGLDLLLGGRNGNK